MVFISVLGLQKYLAKIHIQKNFSHWSEKKAFTLWHCIFLDLRSWIVFIRQCMVFVDAPPLGLVSDAEKIGKFPHSDYGLHISYVIAGVLIPLCLITLLRKVQKYGHFVKEM